MAGRPRRVGDGRQGRASQESSYACSQEWHSVEPSACTGQGSAVVVAGEVGEEEDPVGMGKRVQVISHTMVYFSGCSEILCKVSMPPTQHPHMVCSSNEYNKMGYYI